LIYGGNDVGLMGAVPRSAHEAGARVVGVLPESIARHVAARKLADEN
jgi:predicted Rossmann-fold nucleotide-binding protein